MCIEKKDETLKKLLSTVDDQIIIACYPHDIANLSRFCANWFDNTCFTVYTGEVNEDESIKTVAAISLPISIDIRMLDVLAKEVKNFIEPKIKIFAVHNGEVAQSKIVGGCENCNLSILCALERWGMLK